MSVKLFEGKELSIKDIIGRREQIIDLITEKISEDKIWRFEIGIVPTDPLKWLSAQKDYPKFYLRERGKTSPERAASGEIITIKGNSGSDRKTNLSKICEILKNSSENVKFFGGLSIFEKIRKAEWKEFGNFRFHVPHFELTRSGDKYTFALNINGKNFDETELNDRLTKLSDDTKFSERIELNLKTRVETPGFENWKKLIDDYLKKIRSGLLKKIVASRCVNVTFSETVEPYPLLRKLIDESDKSSVFMTALKKGSFFFGATPEMLYHRNMNNLQTEALAGTRPFFKGDDRFEKELMSSDKERREHRAVIDFISERLKTISSSVSVKETGVLKLSKLQHIYTEIESELKKGIEDTDILFLLMPTPAVCGEPPEESRKILEETEVCDRGWYSGTVGFIGKESSSFYVSIRSALVNGEEIMLFSGAGIVEGTDAKREWDETRLKFMKIERALGYEH